MMILLEKKGLMERSRWMRLIEQHGGNYCDYGQKTHNEADVHMTMTSDHRTCKPLRSSHTGHSHRSSRSCESSVAG